MIAPPSPRAPSQWPLSAEGKPGDVQRHRTLALPEQAVPSPISQAAALPLARQIPGAPACAAEYEQGTWNNCPQGALGTHPGPAAPHVPCHHRKTMDHKKKRDVDYFQAPETGTSHTT